MSCLSGKATDLSERLTGVAKDASERLSVIASDLSVRLTARCGVVCALPEFTPYLNVEDIPIWLTPENGFSQDVVVYSNVEWIIE